jgi:phospholipase/carboxylesterase
MPSQHDSVDQLAGTADAWLDRILLPTLVAIETLSFIARHADPMAFDAVMDAVGRPDDALRAAWRNPENDDTATGTAKTAVKVAGDAALAAFDGLRAAVPRGADPREIFKALRHLPRAQEAIYPLAAVHQAVNRFFLDPSVRSVAEVVARGAQPARDGKTGIIHRDNEPGMRGGFSIYVPEFYTVDRAWPLVVALHGGSGHGRGFLWSWLRDARSFGAIVVAPTATGPTWALMGEDTDTPNLKRILAHVCDHWNIDPSRMLMTGMSDGGTFCYVSGLEADSPFTHLAPVSATFHPLMAAMADADRVHGLPIHIVHGVLDWMFPVEVARQTRERLAAAGANVTYREIDDLSHCYPREVNVDLLDWLATA